MQFNSNDFLIFFAAFSLAYICVRRSGDARNLLIVAASYVFYGWWDYRFVSLLLFTSLVDFGAGIAIDRSVSPSGRKAWLGVGLAVNLSVLAIFKYFDFFQESLANLLASSGYSDIACGLARMLGFELRPNFLLPYFATSVRDFWRRWHISLSTWFRDYVYVPLGGNRRGSDRTLLNLTLAGLWHGAAVNFVLWGLWHGSGLAMNHWWSERPGSRSSMPPWLARSITLFFVLVGWILFRAQSPEQILALAEGMTRFSWPIWWAPHVSNLALLSMPLLAVQAWQHRSGDLIAPLTLPRPLKALLQGALLFGIVVFWKSEAAPFIYFQF